MIRSVLNTCHNSLIRSVLQTVAAPVRILRGDKTAT
jgi:hypothetical protein